MNNETGKAVRTEADWAALVEAREKSGQSAAVFCRRQGISYSLFLYYRRKILKKRYGGQLIVPSAARMPSGRSGGFIPVVVERSSGMRLKFPMGLVLESDEMPSASWVAEGRKNWLFSDSVAGAKASAAIYSVMVSAKQNGHNEYAYFHYLLEKLPQAEEVEDFEALLPHELKAPRYPRAITQLTPRQMRVR